MPESTYLALPFLEAGQAQKHVTHNEALRILDAIVQLSVTAVSASAPEAPEDGERHIVAAGASGDFAGEANKVAIYEDGAWRFLTPRTGWRAWSEDDEALLLWTGTGWVAFESGGGDGGGFDPDDVDHIYLNDAAPGDANVKFAMRGESALLHAIPAAESGSGDVRLQVSKETSADTASVYFATNFSGRAEFGLAGSDNFKLKVSADGTGWTEALDIDKTTGRVRLPAALALTDADQVVARRNIRERLQADRTYYVRTDGSNSNNGLANTAGGAFLTIQKAYDTICAELDLSGYSATIQIGDGTYTGATIFSQPWTGGGTVIIQGNSGTPANVVIHTTAADCFSNMTVLPGILTLKDMTLQTSTSGHGIKSVAPGTIRFGNLRFGALGGSWQAHIFGNGPGVAIEAISNYAVTGGTAAHVYATEGSRVNLAGRTVTLSGTMNFADAFVAVARAGVLMAHGMTFTGSYTVTGKRFDASQLGFVFTAAGGANYFPGNAAGTGSTPGASPYGLYV